VSQEGRGDRVVALLATTIVFWSLNVTIVKSVVDEWQPLAYSVIRFVIGSAIFATWVYLRERSFRIARRDLPMLALAAFIGIAVNQTGFMYAEQHTSATTISLLMATTPAFAAVTGIAFGERVTGLHWVGIAVAALGTLLVLVGGSGKLDFSSIQGDLFALVMAGSWGIYSAMIRPLMGRYSAPRISVIVLLIGTPMMLPFALPQLVRQDYGALSTGAWAALFYSLFFSLVFTNIMWFTAIHRGGAAKATAVLPLQPFLGAIFAFLLLGEHLAWLQLAGGVVIVAGILLTRIREPETGTPD
jgi:drug/metabolite transporter (DMT)-like permease